MDIRYILSIIWQGLLYVLNFLPAVWGVIQRYCRITFDLRKSLFRFRTSQDQTQSGSEHDNSEGAMEGSESASNFPSVEVGQSSGTAAADAVEALPTLLLAGNPRQRRDQSQAEYNNSGDVRITNSVVKQAAINSSNTKITVHKYD